MHAVIQSKEALQMAGSLLMSVSKDEREQAVYRSRRMYETDMQSNIATAEDREEQRGLQIKAFAIARNMIADGEPVEKIARYTGLSFEEVKRLSV
jgi:predicted transposase/invertase (TIGR01784 family)